MQTQAGSAGNPIGIVFLGNCNDRGIGLDGEGYAHLVQYSLRQRLPSVAMRFRHRPTPHPEFFATDVDHLIATRADVVIIGAHAHVLRETIRVNRLWGLSSFGKAVDFVANIDRRVESDAALLRRFGTTARKHHPLRRSIAPIFAAHSR